MIENSEEPKEVKKNLYGGVTGRYVPYLKVFRCRGGSPECAQHKSHGYVKSRVNQPFCIPCLKYKGILNNYPVKKVRK